MDLKNELKVRLGSDGILVFGRPSIDEINAYTRAKFPSTGRRIKNNMSAAQVKYFDRWIRRIENISADGKPLTLDNLVDFPASVKCQVMFEAFDRSDIEVADDEGEPVGEDLEGN